MKVGTALWAKKLIQVTSKHTSESQKVLLLWYAIKTKILPVHSAFSQLSWPSCSSSWALPRSIHIGSKSGHAGPGYFRLPPKISYLHAHPKGNIQGKLCQKSSRICYNYNVYDLPWPQQTLALPTLGCQIDEYTRLFGTKKTWRKKQTQRQTKVFNENPTYSFIWPYSFNWHLRVVNLSKKGV